MALTSCKECGKQISTDARACPHCGCPRPGITVLPVRNRTVVFLVVVCLIILAFYLQTRRAARRAYESEHPAAQSPR